MGKRTQDVKRSRGDGFHSRGLDSSGLAIYHARGVCLVYVKYGRVGDSEECPKLFDRGDLRELLDVPVEVLVHLPARIDPEDEGPCVGPVRECEDVLLPFLYAFSSTLPALVSALCVT